MGPFLKNIPLHQYILSSNLKNPSSPTHPSYIFPVTRYLFKSANILKLMPHIKKHPDYMKKRTRSTKLHKGDYEHGVDRVRKRVDTGKKKK